MRIISGCRRGHKLLDFQGQDIRPTTDRVKEAIFSMIAAHIQGTVVLDMFAGSGALSFEMLSRGAERAVLIEKNKRSFEVIKKNIESLGFEELCVLEQCSCFDYVKRCTDCFDVVFLDPPYNKGLIEQALGAIIEYDILSDNGIIVLESDNTDFKSDFEGLDIIKQKHYGRTFITIYTKAK